MSVDEQVEELGPLPNGCTLYRKPNRVGGHRYFSDEIGGGVDVWDTCLVAESTLLAAILAEQTRRHTEWVLKQQKKRFKRGGERGPAPTTGRPPPPPAPPDPTQMSLPAH